LFPLALVLFINAWIEEKHEPGKSKSIHKFNGWLIIVVAIIMATTFFNFYNTTEASKELLIIIQSSIDSANEGNLISTQCSTNTFNCEDFGSQLEAQRVFLDCGGLSNDIHYLDGDEDGIACETLP